MSDPSITLDSKWAREVIRNPPASLAGDWEALGACGPAYRETGEDWWFEPDTERAGTTFPLELASKARTVCRACPVRAECLLEAWNSDDGHGIWGGLTPYQRTRIRTELAAKAA